MSKRVTCISQIVALVAIAMLCFACQGNSSQTSSKSVLSGNQETDDKLNALDFAGFKDLTLGSPDTLVFDPVAAGPISSSRELRNPVESYNEQERRLLGGWLTPGKKRASLVRTMNLIRSFESQHGRFPASGRELLTWQISTASNEQLKRFCSSSVSEQYNLIASAFNPATGAPFESFSQGEWKKYRVMIFPTVREEDYYRTLHCRSDEFEKLAGRPLPELWRIIACGDEQDEILVDKCIGVERTSDLFAEKSIRGEAEPCGCDESVAQELPSTVTER